MSWCINLISLAFVSVPVRRREKTTAGRAELTGVRSLNGLSSSTDAWLIGFRLGPSGSRPSGAGRAATRLTTGTLCSPVGRRSCDETATTPRLFARTGRKTFVRLFANAHRRQRVEREERETRAGGEMPAREPLTRHGASTSTRGRFAFGLCCRSNETR